MTGTTINGVGTFLGGVASDISEGVNDALASGWPIAGGILAFFIGWRIFKKVSRG